MHSSCELRMRANCCWVRGAQVSASARHFVAVFGARAHNKYKRPAQTQTTHTHTMHMYTPAHVVVNVRFHLKIDRMQIARPRLRVWKSNLHTQKINHGGAANRNALRLRFIFEQLLTSMELRSLRTGRLLANASELDVDEVSMLRACGAGLAGSIHTA